MTIWCRNTKPETQNTPWNPSDTPTSTSFFFPRFVSSCLAFTTCRYLQLHVELNGSMAPLPWHYTNQEGTRAPLESGGSSEKAHKTGGRSTNILPGLVLKKRTVGQMHGCLSTEWLHRWLAEWITEHTSNLCSQTELGGFQIFVFAHWTPNRIISTTSFIFVNMQMTNFLRKRSSIGLKLTPTGESWVGSCCGTKELQHPLVMDHWAAERESYKRWHPFRTSEVTFCDISIHLQMNISLAEKMPESNHTARPLVQHFSPKRELQGIHGCWNDVTPISLMWWGREKQCGREYRTCEALLGEHLAF